MKKVFFALLTIVVIGACNTPQRMTSPTGDSMMNAGDSSNTMQADSTVRRDSL